MREDEDFKAPQHETTGEPKPAVPVEDEVQIEKPARGFGNDGRFDLKDVTFQPHAEFPVPLPAKVAPIPARPEAFKKSYRTAMYLKDQELLAQGFTQKIEQPHRFAKWVFNTFIVPNAIFRIKVKLQRPAYVAGGEVTVNDKDAREMEISVALFDKVIAVSRIPLANRTPITKPHITYTLPQSFYDDGLGNLDVLDD